MENEPIARALAARLAEYFGDPREHFLRGFEVARDLVALSTPPLADPMAALAEPAARAAGAERESAAHGINDADRARWYRFVCEDLGVPEGSAIEASRAAKAEALAGNRLVAKAAGMSGPRGWDEIAEYITARLAAKDAEIGRLKAAGFDGKVWSEFSEMLRDAGVPNGFTVRDQLRSLIAKLATEREARAAAERERDAAQRDRDSEAERADARGCIEVDLMDAIQRLRAERTRGKS